MEDSSCIPPPPLSVTAFMIKMLLKREGRLCFYNFFTKQRDSAWHIGNIKHRWNIYSMPSWEAKGHSHHDDDDANDDGTNAGTSLSKGGSAWGAVYPSSTTEFNKTSSASVCRITLVPRQLYLYHRAQIHIVVACSIFYSWLPFCVWEVASRKGYLCSNLLEPATPASVSLWFPYWSLPFPTSRLFSLYGLFRFSSWKFLM